MKLEGMPDEFASLVRHLVSGQDLQSQPQPTYQPTYQYQQPLLPGVVMGQQSVVTSQEVLQLPPTQLQEAHLEQPEYQSAHQSTYQPTHQSSQQPIEIERDLETVIQSLMLYPRLEPIPLEEVVNSISAPWDAETLFPTEVALQPVDTTKKKRRFSKPSKSTMILIVEVMVVAALGAACAVIYFSPSPSIPTGNMVRQSPKPSASPSVRPSATPKPSITPLAVPTPPPPPEYPLPAVKP